MIKHALEEIVSVLDKQCAAVGIARNDYLSKKAEKANLRARLMKASPEKSIAAKEMDAEATDEWLQFEKELNRLEAVYDFQKEKFGVLDKEYQAQYLELRDNGHMIKRQGA